MSRDQRQGSPLPTSSPSVIKRNRRGIQLVDGAFTKLRQSGVKSGTASPPDSPTSSQPTGEVTSLSPPLSVMTSQVSRSVPARPKSGPSFLHHALNPSISSNSDSLTTEFHRPKSTSPALSNRSSVSSQSESLSSLSTIQLPIQGSMLQDIRQQMVTSLNRMRKLEEKVKKIPELKLAIKQLRNVNLDLQSQLKLEVKREEELRQQVEKLRLDNLQLATNSSAIASESDLHVLRCTLVTSIDHFKQLEEDNKLIPVLKGRISQMEKELSVREGTNVISVEHASSSKLKRIEGDVKQLNHTISTLLKRLEQFELENGATNKNLNQQICDLEKENSVLSSELRKLKSNSDHCEDTNFSDNLLMKENISLRNTVLRLKDKLLQTENDARRQREQLTLKLFDMEAINVQASALDVQEQVTAVGHEQAQQLSEPTSTDDKSEVKKLQLRLRQVEIQSKQSQHLIQTLLAQRVVLERRMTQLLQEKKGGVVATNRSSVSMMENIVMELEGSHSDALLSSGVITRPTADQEKIQLRMKELEEGLAKAKVASIGAEDSRKLQRDLRSLQKEHGKLETKHEILEQQLSSKDTEISQLKETSAKYDDLSNEYCQLVENYDKAKLHIEQVEADAKQYKEDFENASAEVTAMGEQVQETEVRLCDLQATYDDLFTEKNQIEEEMATLKVDHESELAVAEERLEALETEKQSLLTEVNTLREKVVSLSDETSTLLCEKRSIVQKLETISAESPALLQENIELKFKVEKFEEELRVSNKKMEGLQQELAAAEKEVLEKAVVETKYQTELSKWKVTIATLEKEMDSSSKERELLRKQVEERNTSLSHCTADLTRSRNEHKKSCDELGEAKQQLIQLQEQLSAQQQQLQSLTVAKEKLQINMMSQIEQLSLQVTSLKGQLATSEGHSVQVQSSCDEKMATLEEDYSAKCKELEEHKKINRTANEQLNLKFSQAQRETMEAKELTRLLQQQIHDFQRDHTSLQSDKEVSMETIHQLEQKLHSKNCKIAELEATLASTSSSLQTSIDNVEDEKKSVQEKCNRLEKQLLESKDRLSSFSNSVRETEQLYHIEKERNAALAADLQRVRKELDDMQQEHINVSADLVRYSSNEKTIQEQLTASQQVTVETEAKMTSLQSDLAHSSTKCAELRQQLIVLDEKCSTLEIEKSVGNTRIEELHSQMTLKDKEWKEAMETELAQLRHQLTDSESARSEAVSKSEDLEKKLALTTESFTNELTKLKHERDFSASKVIDNEGDLSLTRAKNEKLIKEVDDLKAEAVKLSEVLKSSKQDVAKLETEVTGLKGKLLISQDEFLATQTSRDRLMERYDNLELDHEQLKHRVQLELGQSSQLKADNKELFRLLQSAQGEMPSLQTQATRSIQDENEKLEKEISVLSQWNDKQRQELEVLEKKLSVVTDQKQKVLVELIKKENYEQENRQLKKELKEVEQEVLVLKNKTDSEELSMKLQAQLQLVAVFNEHNKSLQDQVLKLQDQVITLGGQPDHMGPVEPSVEMILEQPGGVAHTSKGGRRKRLGSGGRSNRSSKSVTPATTNGQMASDVAMEVSTLLNENEMLKRKLTSLEAHMSSNEFTSPEHVTRQNLPPVVRQPSVLFALSSVHSVESGTPEESVPTDLLLPCSLLADALSSGKDISSPNMQQHLSAVKSSWFNCVAQKDVTASQVESYLTTFHRLSPQLLSMVVNSADEEGNTGLHHAVSTANPGVMNILLGCEGLSTNHQNQAEYTPTMLAAVTKVESDVHRDTLKRLLSKSDVNFKGKDGQTALMLAACIGDHVMLQLLLDANAEPNIQDMDGSTALMCACEHGHLEATRLLVTNQTCDATIKDNDGVTAVDVAMEAGNNDIVLLLQSIHKNT